MPGMSQPAPTATWPVCGQGRYFLHVYDDEPKYYLPYQGRAWVKALHTAGRQKPSIDRLAGEPDAARKWFGNGLDDVNIELHVSNFVTEPLAPADPPHAYTCILTRIDALKVSIGDRYFRQEATRAWGEAHAGDYLHISARVAERLGSLKESEKQDAEADEDQDEVEGEGVQADFQVPQDINAPANPEPEAH